jgi:M-phase inducer tyrosine phosphatase
MTFKITKMLAKCSSQIAIDLGLPLPDFSFGTVDDDSPMRACRTRRFSAAEETFGPVSPAELHELMKDPLFHGYNDILILDARFGYEYEGGHIRNAQNVAAPAQMLAIYDRYRYDNVCVVIHCEFSQERGPNLLSAFREHDRSVNRDCYPHIAYPHVFLLEGGYRRFAHEFAEDCEGGYVTMRDDEYAASGELKQARLQYDRDWHKGNKRIPIRRVKSEGDCVCKVSPLQWKPRQCPMTPN